MHGRFPLDVQRASPTQLRLERRFACSPALVYRAHLEPELLTLWLGVRMPLVVCEVDARVGGGFRYVWAHPDHGEMGMSGTYLELVPGQRIVNEEVFDQDWTGGTVRVTSRFLPDDVGCLLELTILYSSPEALEGALKTGMTEGMTESYERLDELVEEPGVQRPV